RVLIAEDNPDNQRVARLILEKIGCRVDTAANGKEALEMVQRIPYGIVFMDCQMPEMDGYEATREIRRREAGGRRLPIIALTAHAMEGDRRKCIEAGMDDYVIKPVRRELLREVLARWASPAAVGAEPAPSSSNPVPGADLDPELFDALRTIQEDGGAEMTASLVASFVQHTGEKIASLRRALTSHDVARVKLLTHDLKGSCATFGATSIVRACVELEARAKANSLSEATSLFEQIERSFLGIEDALAHGRLFPEAV
ncbi:MAG: response regulator, partial [Candidatus Binatia bacterium]